MTTRSKLVLGVHRVILRIAGRRLARGWAWAYLMLARVWAAYLVWGERDPTAYVRGSMGSEDLVPGISDVDVAVLLPVDAASPGSAAGRARERWERLRRRFRLTDLLLDYPMIFEHDELEEVVNSSTFTYGLDEPADGRPAYFGERVSPDKIRLLERPGLYGTTTDWQLLRGLDRLPRERARDSQLRRIAAWLELCEWWQWVFPACADPRGPRTASLCVKLVAEPTRIWLWLAHGERLTGREQVLRRALDRLPDEEGSLRRALALLHGLPDCPEPPLGEALAVLVRLSVRIADLIGSEIADTGTTTVRLAGAAPPELIFPRRGWHLPLSLGGGPQPQPLPLCDWRSLTFPRLPDESFAPLEDDVCDPAVLAAATGSHAEGPYPALRADGLILLAAKRPWARLRAIKCAVTDPVSFALIEGRHQASFPNVRGWSAQDSAARAVAEHRARLDAPETSSDVHAAGATLAMLLSAARAALFAESLADGAVPELPLTLTETARRLAARSAAASTIAEDALECYREFAVSRTPPPAAMLNAVRAIVRQLPPYANRGGRPSG